VITRKKTTNKEALSRVIKKILG